MSNKSVKERMIKMYGSECWIEKLHLRPPETKPQRYKSKGQQKRMRQLTYHHIKPKSKGGQATVENGALLSAENHAWLHRQSPEVQSKLNQIFQEYKKDLSTCSYSSINISEVNFDDFVTKAKRHYNRAKMKRETKKMVDDMEI